MGTGAKSKICFAVSSPMTANAFLREHISALSGRFVIDLAANASHPSELESVACHARIFQVPIRRKISPLDDLMALLRLHALFRRERYAAVCSVTPKAGMLAMLAAALSGVPFRIHIFTGQVWATRKGWKRRALKLADRAMARLATHVLADSPSQRDFMVAEGVVAAEKANVLGNGSICGVDGERFRPDSARRAEIRDRHGIPASAIVFLFVGRLNRDKGVLDLAEAFSVLERPDAWLLVVGPDEEGMRAAMQSRLGASLERCRFVGFTDRPEDYMAAADVFCLPSYREGFGMVIIEAAAVGIPSIASRIYGITDAVDEDATGLLHRPGDIAEIARDFSFMADDATRRTEMGLAARQRALNLFSRRTVTDAWVQFFGHLLD
jgi:glycosyltransferase involved in cell wall biosynthesis